MNSSATSDAQITPSECEIQSYLQGGQGQTALEVYVVLVLIAFVNVMTCPWLHYIGTSTHRVLILQYCCERLF